MKTFVIRVLIVVGVAFVGAQFFRPDRNNPPVDPALQLQAKLSVPADVQGLLDRACADCHTHSTQWPWYSGVAPASWFVAGHVEEGREHMNLDRWAEYSDYDAQKILDEVAEEVSEKKMPLPNYLPLHPEAKLSDEERARIAAWATGARDGLLRTLEGDGESEVGPSEEDSDAATEDDESH